MSPKPSRISCRAEVLGHFSKYKRSIDLLSSSHRPCSSSAAWPQAVISAVACVAAVTVAVVNVNPGRPWTKNRTFTSPRKTWRPR